MNPSSYPLALWPEAASAVAAQIDYLILAFTALTILLVAPIFIGITYWAVYYREGRDVNREHRESRNMAIEMTWMIVPFALTLIFFGWGARIFDINQHPPANALRIEAIGRQWMWKFEQPGGQSEINDLHVPEGRPVLIHMTSQDVIHSLYIPALRIQFEVLPSRYTEMWFNANRTGRFHLYCSEYCGTDHSLMAGILTIMKPADYQRWLTQNGSERSMAAQGKLLFATYGCSGCHNPGSTVRAPSLDGLYGNPVPLADGRIITADDQYIHDKILMPNKQKLAGYKQVMPTFKGIIPEDEVLKLVAYIKSLGQANAEPMP